MKIVFNNTLSILNYNDEKIMPGSNVVESFDESHPIIGLYINSGDLEVFDSSKMTLKEKNKALIEATSISTIDKLKSLFKELKTEEQKKKINDFSKKFNESLKENK